MRAVLTPVLLLLISTENALVGAEPNRYVARVPQWEGIRDVWQHLGGPSQIMLKRQSPSRQDWKDLRGVWQQLGRAAPAFKRQSPDFSGLRGVWEHLGSAAPLFKRSDPGPDWRGLREVWEHLGGRAPAFKRSGPEWEGLGGVGNIYGRNPAFK